MSQTVPLIASHFLGGSTARHGSDNADVSQVLFFAACTPSICLVFTGHLIRNRLYGLTLAQTWYYFHSFPNDSRHTKILVSTPFPARFSSSLGASLPGCISKVDRLEQTILSGNSSRRQYSWHGSDGARVRVNIPIHNCMGRRFSHVGLCHNVGCFPRGCDLRIHVAA